MGGSGRGSSARGWDVSNAELKQRIIELMSERNATGVAIDNAIKGRLPEHHSMLNRLQIIAKLAAQRDQLLASLKELLSSKAEPGLFAGVAAADNAMKLVKSIEDGEWVVADHSPDAGKMVPDGWQLVPMKPTYEMLDAAMAPKGRTVDGRSNPHTISDKYIAMLAAAPKLGGE